MEGGAAALASHTIGVLDKRPGLFPLPPPPRGGAAEEEDELGWSDVEPKMDVWGMVARASLGAEEVVGADEEVAEVKILRKLVKRFITFYVLFIPCMLSSVSLFPSPPRASAAGSSDS